MNDEPTLEEKELLAAPSSPSDSVRMFFDSLVDLMCEYHSVRCWDRYPCATSDKIAKEQLKSEMEDFWNHIFFPSDRTKHLLEPFGSDISSKMKS